MKRHQQRGMSFVGLLIVGVVVACTFVIGAQVAPTVIEYQAIVKAAKKSQDGSTVPEVRSIFDKAAQIDDIKSITGKDLAVTKNGDKTVVQFEYNREIPLFGPAFLLLKYNNK
jgi:beta-lactam-binding protein with PASTA domain